MPFGDSKCVLFVKINTDMILPYKGNIHIYTQSSKCSEILRLKIPHLGGFSTSKITKAVLTLRECYH